MTWQIACRRTSRPTGPASGRATCSGMGSLIGAGRANIAVRSPMKKIVLIASARLLGGALRVPLARRSPTACAFGHLGGVEPEIAEYAREDGLPTLAVLTEPRVEL